MKKLFIIDLKDYDSELKRFKRPSARAIIINDGKIAMVYSQKYDYYKFPGGGIEAGESREEALIREVQEETGLRIIPDSIKEYGSVLRIQKSTYNDNEIFEQENYYYLCNAEDSLITQNLDDYESDEGFKLEFVMPDYARNVNRTHNHNGYDNILIEREAKVLEMLETDILHELK
ncbi:MAG: NUDIX domain-containing protein [Alistipes sp.]|nr:NUDIX domain-containing protein [Alistipes sp.]